jgi:hypothetical protein
MRKGTLSHLDKALTKMERKQSDPLETQAACGPWPFTTRRVFQLPDQTIRTWNSRHHRKGLRPAVPAEVATLWHCLWAPGQLNWWIGTIFAVGSLLFAAGSVLSLVPGWAEACRLSSREVNAFFFIGSIPFTIAAYLQLYQVANTPRFQEYEFLASAQSCLKRRRMLIGWRPTDIGWLSSALQLVGTLLFNLNTFNALNPSLTWLQQDREIWAPDFIGSLFFLASGTLAFIETCHAWWAWKPTSLSWWVTFVNLLGCIGFMISALFAYVPPGSPHLDAIWLSTLFTLQGALCFLVGSLLLLPEASFGADP